MAWFPLFWARLLTATAGWPADALGAYVRLLCHQWAQGGIPDDAGMLGAIAGPIKSWRAVWGSYLEAKFPVDEDGQRRNRALEEIRIEQSKRSDRGRSAAEKRWNKQCQSSANALPKQCKSDAGLQCVSNALALPQEIEREIEIETPTPSYLPAPQNPEGVGLASPADEEGISDGWDRLMAAWPVRDQEIKGQREFFFLFERWPTATASEVVERGLEHAEIYRRSGKDRSKIPSLATWCREDRWRDTPDALRDRVGVNGEPARSASSTDQMVTWKGRTVLFSSLPLADRLEIIDLQSRRATE